MRISFLGVSSTSQGPQRGPNSALSFFQGIETRLNAYGPLYVEKQPKYWLNLAESFIKARNATTGAPMF